jgi:hypothetical protein
VLPGLLHAILLTGCAPPPEAPSELDDLSRYLYREWGNDDERVQVAGLLNLEAFLEGVDEGAGLDDGTKIADRSWALDNLVDDDVASLPSRPDRDLDGMIAMSVARSTPYDVACHAELQVQPDQLPVEKGSATDYTRTFPGRKDGACFPDASCDELDTSNDVRRANAFMATRFTLLKDFRWFDLVEDDGATRRAFYSRSWLPTSFPGEHDGEMMWQSYSIDVWLERPDGSTWRYQVLWSETDTGEDFPIDWQTAAITNGTDGAMADGDAAIEDLGLCE